MRSQQVPLAVVPHRRRERPVPSEPPIRRESSGPPEGDAYWDWRPAPLRWKDHEFEWRPRAMFSMEEYQYLIFNPFPDRFRGAAGPLGPGGGQSGFTGLMGISDLMDDEYFRPLRRSWTCHGECGCPRAGLQDVRATRVVPGYAPNYLEIRCRKCLVGSYANSRMPIKDGLEEALKPLRGRWVGMGCDEVGDYLVVHHVMES